MALPALAWLLLALAPGVAVGHQLRGPSPTESGVRRPSFQAWYEAYYEGPGLWKWRHALVAYERHLGPLAGYPLEIVQAGVRSGGSLRMWRDVLGDRCRISGIDGDPRCRELAGQDETITTGDLSDPAAWRAFFNVSGSPVDVVVSDGGNEAKQMVTTISETFPHLRAGGLIAVEDIYGEGYEHSLFGPVADMLASSGQLAAVHVYPFMLMVQKAGQGVGLPVSDLSFVGSYVTVSDFDQMWVEVARSWGGPVVLENAGWGPFLSAQGMSNFLRLFSMLHDSHWLDEPTGCWNVPTMPCTSTVQNGPMQGKVTGVHIYPTRLVVEVSRGAVVLSAERRGSKWIAGDH